MCQDYPSIILSILFFILLLVIIVVRVLIKKSPRFHNWIIHHSLNSSFVYIKFPIVVTIVLTILFNLFLFHLDSILGNIISDAADLYFVVLCNLLFALLLFWNISVIQNQFIRIVFNDSILNFISIIEKSHFVNKRFAAELLVLFLKCPRFFSEISIIAGNTVQNLKELIINLETNNGVELTIGLYSNLLNQSIKRIPTKMLSTWDTKLVNIKSNDEYYAYIEHLGNIYHKIKHKQRISLYQSSNEDEFEKELNSSNLINLHKYWSFEVLFIINYDKFVDIRDKHLMAEKNVDDFVIYTLKNEKWLIGKNSDTEKVYLNADKQIVNATEKFYNELIKNSKKIELK